MDGGMIQHPRDLRAARAQAIKALAARSEPRPIDIEDLLGWTYRMQMADCAMSGDGEASSWSSMVYSVRATVPCAGFRFVVAKDALVVHDVVKSTLEAPFQRLVMDCARKGEQPDWCDGVVPRPVMKPAMDARSGLPKWNHREKRAEPLIRWIDRDGGELPQGHAVHNYGYCMVDYDPAFEFIDMCRQIYVHWYDAMMAVLDALKGERLERWLPHGPRVPRKPWDRA